MLPEERKEMAQASRTEMISDTQKDAAKYAGFLKDRELPLLVEALKKLDVIFPKLQDGPFEVSRNLNKSLYAGFQDIRAIVIAIGEAEKHLEKK
jgi:hypothetical protein